MADAEPKPRRRWFQFGLGTMFVLLTLAAVWLGWELKFIRDRKAMYAFVKDRGGSVRARRDCPPYGVHQWTIETPPERIPRWRRWLGDETVCFVVWPSSAQESDIQKAKAMFPEAKTITSTFLDEASE
ncbi:MAG: hypothetical protein HYX69_13840 [Planctomycetia bacterium]|nr:hypothetical protein [Planctomycetia bacterium]